MIDKKYIELINKDIDKEITPKEKAILEEYLNSNLEAKNLQDELLISENLLDKLPEKDPSINLKKQILNSIDINKYSSIKKHSTLLNFIQGTIFETKYKIALTFTLGVIAGLLIYASFFNNSRSFTNDDIGGTIGLRNAELIQSIPLRTSGILGKIDIERINNDLGFDFILNSPEQYDLTFKYDPNKTNFNNISFYGKNKIRLDSENSLLRLSESGKHTYQLFFSSKVKTPVNFDLQISRAGNIVFEKEITVQNN